MPCSHIGRLTVQKANKPGNNSNCNSFLLLVAESHSSQKCDIWALRPHNVTCHPSHPGHPNKAFLPQSSIGYPPPIPDDFLLFVDLKSMGAQPPCSLPLLGIDCGSAWLSPESPPCDTWHVLCSPSPSLKVPAVCLSPPSIHCCTWTPRRASWGNGVPDVDGSIHQQIELKKSQQL